MRALGIPSRWFNTVFAASVCLGLGACASLVGFADGVNLLVDGSFEDGTGPGGSFKPDPGTPGVMSLKSGATSVPGWTLITNERFGQDFAWVQNQNPYVPGWATDGTHFMDLTGVGDKPDPNGHFGVIRQSFATIRGVVYWAKVDIGVRNPASPGPIRVRMAMSATNSNLVEFAQKTCPFNPTASEKETMPCAMYFTANSDSTLISIYGELGRNFIGIDDVRVECVAPLGRHAWCGGAPPL